MVNKIQIICPHQAEFSYPEFMIGFNTNIFKIYRSNMDIVPTYNCYYQKVF